MGGPLILAGLLGGSLIAAPSFDPVIDQAREPPRGFTLGLGVDRLDDTLGFYAEARSPRFADDLLVVALGGVWGWFPGVLRSGDQDQPADGPWSPFGQARLRLEMGLRVAESPHRIFFAVGPSLLFPSAERSDTAVGVGVHGGLGVELFAGDRYRTLPLALVIELGATAHLADADAGLGEAANAAPLATGFALSVGLRLYPIEDGG